MGQVLVFVQLKILRKRVDSIEDERRTYFPFSDGNTYVIQSWPHFALSMSYAQCSWFMSVPCPCKTNAIHEGNHIRLFNAGNLNKHIQYIKDLKVNTSVNKSILNYDLEAG